MNRLRYLLVLLLAMSALLGSPPAHADARCSIAGRGLSFGTVDPSERTDVKGYIDYVCDVSSPGESGKPVWLQMCIGLGPSSNGSLIDRRLNGMDDANGPNPDTLPFQLYTDEARSVQWGESRSSVPPYFTMAAFVVTPPPGEVQTVTGTIQVHGRIPATGELVGAGEYESSLTSDLYFGSHQNSDNVGCMGGGGSGSASERFLFPVSASVPGRCSVVTASDMNFSPVPLTGTSTGLLTSSSTIDLTCTNRTAWQVGLDDGMKPGGGSRQMCNPGGACIAYQLTQPGGTVPWGDDLDTNTVDGISSGAQQTLTVNGRVNDQPLTQAGRYTDTVKVTLTY